MSNVDRANACSAMIIKRKKIRLELIMDTHKWNNYEPPTLIFNPRVISL